jgi:hypothetical protein
MYYNIKIYIFLILSEEYDATNFDLQGYSKTGLCT